MVSYALVENTEFAVSVLILVVVDDGLVQERQQNILNVVINVLILVVVDDGLVLHC